ncbi:MAG: isopentenyl-diphosphate Delta-isomerase [Chlorobium sp.]|jgi:isopentenyl-diphosphate delta-isomerase|nr:isopentenyl-diphosphate Delta-isomerase [Chlorobium sp.]
MKNNHQVSFNDELLILVDDTDSVVGHGTKEYCHSGNGLPHRAFSIFVFNSRNELLIQKRSEQKPLWPLFWSNSVCSHPRQGEDYQEAVTRRLLDEVGLQLPVEFLFRFQYQVKYKLLGAENELCSVFAGKSDLQPNINHNEIADWRYVSLDYLLNDITVQPEQYTPWFKIELEKISKGFLDKILAI